MSVPVIQETRTCVPLPITKELLSNVFEMSASELVSDTLEDNVEFLASRPTKLDQKKLSDYIDELEELGYGAGALVVRAKKAQYHFSAYDLGIVLYAQRWIAGGKEEWAPLRVRWEGTRPTDESVSMCWPDELLVISPYLTPEKRAKIQEQARDQIKRLSKGD